MTLFPNSSAIAWKQLGGLSAVQSAITLLWVIYRLYLPDLLAQFGWPPQFGINLLLIESAIVVLVHPLFGGLSDRSQYWLGTRLPLILLGVTLTSALTIALPSLAIFGSAVPFWHQGIVYVLVFWAIAMAMFHSPILALLQKCASIPSLPLMVSFLNLANGLLKVATPLVSKFMISFGPGVTFALGSVTLLAATAVLRSLIPPTWPEKKNQDNLEFEFPALSLLSVLGLGAGIGFSFDEVVRLSLQSIQGILAAQWTGIGQDEWGLALNASIVILTIPAGILANRYGNRRALIIALGMAVVCSCLLLFPVLGIVAGITLAVMIPFLINGGVALVLALIPTLYSGLGVGLYLGGAAAALGLSNLLFNASSPLLPHQSGGLQIAFCLVALVIVSSSPHPKPLLAK